MAEFFCYVLWHADGETPFYVGSGNRWRVTRAGFMRNSEAREVVRSIRTSGGEPVRTSVSFPTAEEARARELELILKWGRSCDGGLLTNKRIGDRGGVQGRKISSEQVAKMQAARLPHTEQFRKDMSQRMMGNQHRKGHHLTEEERHLRSVQTREGIARKRAAGLR